MTEDEKVQYFTERAVKGIQHLDENEGAWVDSIDLSTLDMLDPLRCVIGQLSGSYWAYADNNPAVDLISLGFNVGEGEMNQFDRANYEILRDVWTALIIEKRGV